MTAVCPSGHVSATADYCDQCGTPIGAAAAAQQPGEPPAAEELDTSPAARHEPCPACGAPRSGDDRYCEGCGYDFIARPAPAAVWEAVASADRAQFDALATAGVEFPAAYPERRFALTLDEVRIGRSRGRDGEQIPEIDLAGAPTDPGISHLHAALVRQDDGSYAVRDLGSTNGTILGDGPTPVGEQPTAPLVDGDRIRIGAWTTITLRRR